MKSNFHHNVVCKSIDMTDEKHSISIPYGFVGFYSKNSNPQFIRVFPRSTIKTRGHLYLLRKGSIRISGKFGQLKSGDNQDIVMNFILKLKASGEFVDTCVDIMGGVDSYCENKVTFKDVWNYIEPEFKQAINLYIIDKSADELAYTDNFTGVYDIVKEQLFRILVEAGIEFIGFSRVIFYVKREIKKIKKYPKNKGVDYTSKKFNTDYECSSTGCDEDNFTSIKLGEYRNSIPYQVDVNKKSEDYDEVVPCRDRINTINTTEFDKYVLRITAIIAVLIALFFGLPMVPAISIFLIIVVISICLDIVYIKKYAN